MPLADSNDGLTALIVHPTYYEIANLEGTRRAVDSWLGRIEAIWELHSRTQVLIPTLVTYPAEGNAPLNYAFNQGMKLAKRFPNLPHGRTVFLGTDGFIIQLADFFLQMMKLNNFSYRYMHVHQRAEAVAWLSELNVNLLSDDPSSQMFPTVDVQQRPRDKGFAG